MTNLTPFDIANNLVAKAFATQLKPAPTESIEPVVDPVPTNTTKQKPTPA